MIERNERLRPGDMVEVKMPDEILETLDAEGATDSLPFMPEMIESCGRRFRVSNRVVKVCLTAAGSSPRTFRNNDVVLLDEVRCTGAAHDGCRKACMIFWRDKWLRKVTESDRQETVDAEGKQRLRSRLRTSTGPKTYYCQASEIVKATEHLSRAQRYQMCITDVREGNCSALEMVLRIGRFLLWKVFIGDFRCGNGKATDGEVLNLKPGELVEVKPLNEIIQTLDSHASHRGLLFMRGMRHYCGKQARVNERIDRIIMDGTGEMRQLRNTVQLEGSVCGCAYQGVGGCSRREISYWREIWLRRSQS